MKEEEKLESIAQFEKKTFKEVRLWDWLGRILPLTVLLVASICHFFKWNTALDLILQTSILVFFITSFIWWYWAIYKIAVAIKYVRESQEKFLSIREEFRKFKEALNNTNSK